MENRVHKLLTRHINNLTVSNTRGEGLLIAITYTTTTIFTNTKKLGPASDYVADWYFDRKNLPWLTSTEQTGP